MVLLLLLLLLLLLPPRQQRLVLWLLSFPILLLLRPSEMRNNITQAQGPQLAPTFCICYAGTCYKHVLKY
jgi:hypothetical protein